VNAPPRNISSNNFLGILKLSRVQFSIVLLVCSYYCAISTSVVLDDAFIYFRVVENFLRSGIPVFNQGENYFIVTSPLWTFLLAVGKFLFRTMELEILAKLLWIVSLMLASYFTYESFSSFLGRWAILLPSLFFLSPAVGSMMGNEIALLYTAIFGLLWASTKNKPIWSGVFFGIGYLARGEFLLFIIPVSIYCIVSKKDQINRFQPTRAYFILLCSAAALIIIPWHLYYWFTFHQIVPDTLHIKMVQGASGIWPLFSQNIWEAIVWLLNNHIALLVIAAFGAFRHYKIFGLIASYTLLHSLLYAWLKIPLYHWYYYDYYIFTLVLVFFGAIETIQLCISSFERIKKPSVRTIQIVRTIIASALMICILWFFQIRFQYFTPAYIQNIYLNNGTDERYNTYRALSARLRSELHSNHVVLTEELGICSYYLPTIEVRDVAGIATPAITESTMYHWAYFIDLYKPRFLIFIKSLSGDIRSYDFNGRHYAYRLRFVTNPGAEYFAGSVFERMD
jgi:hypothetical protein